MHAKAETPLTYEDKWLCYFTAAASLDLLAVFDAIVALGMRPVPIGEDSTGAIKIPIGNDWGLTGNESRRKLLARYIAEQIPVGVGVQADGYIVLDIDPPNKDRGRLAEAWKEAAALLLGNEDWPDTLTIKTKAGCHVWFKVSDRVREAWQSHGKLKMPLPCGGAVEFFTGNKKQMQVATAPSDGKAIARNIVPAELPFSVETAILDLLKHDFNSRPVIKSNLPATAKDEKWFMERLKKLAYGVLNAKVSTRHDKYRAAVTTAAGYVEGMNLPDKYETVYENLAGSHKEAKPEVSEYVLTATFRWAWNRGVGRPLDRPRHSTDKQKPEIAADHNGILPEDSYTDLKFARLVIDRYGDQFKYIEEWKEWAAWDESNGVWVKTGVRHHEFFKAFAVGDDEYLGSSAKIKAASSLCMSDVKTLATPDNFDSLSDYINLENGVLDLVNFRLLDHGPSFMATKQAAVKYDPSAKCPEFLKTLERVQPDIEIRQFLQRWLGTILTGQTLAESVVNYGDGANGKSTIFETIGMLMGSYYAKMPRGFIAKTKNERHPAELVTLYGARFALASETDISDALDESKIKMILGDGTITARGMNENFWTFTPTHKFAIAANHMPSIVGQDSGIWRRLAFVPWEVTIPEEERQPEYEKVLYGESSGILNWLIAGLQLYRQIGLQIPEKIKAASREVKASSDWLSEFFNETFTTKKKSGMAEESRIRASQVYELYKKWVKSNGGTILPMSKAVPLFTKRVEEFGLLTPKPNNVRWYIGLRVKDENDHESEIDDFVTESDKVPF